MLWNCLTAWDWLLGQSIALANYRAENSSAWRFAGPANQPKVLLADEPTGNLDPHSADGVFAQLLHLVRSTGVAARIATHNPELARRMDRVGA